VILKVYPPVGMFFFDIFIYVIKYDGSEAFVQVRMHPPRESFLRLPLYVSKWMEYAYSRQINLAAGP
jgi:hypothetical protein